MRVQTLPPYASRVAIRLVLAEDHYLVREGVRRLLETQPELEVVAACGDLDSLLAAVEAERPDVVVTDIRMPPGGRDEGIRAAAAPPRDASRTSASSSSASTPSRAMRSRSSKAAPRGAPTS